MRVLLTTQPGHGHFRPLLPLAHGLRAAGHEVQVGTSASFATVVESEGLTAVAAGRDWVHGNDATSPPELRDAPPDVDSLATFFAWKFVRMTAEPLARDVLALAQRWRPDLIVRETTEFGGSLAAQALGVPSAAVQVATPTLISPDVLAEVGKAVDQVRGRLRLARDRDLAALRDELVICFAPPALHDPSIALPRGLRSFHPGSPATKAPRPAAISDLGLVRPIVYATLGTVFNDAELVRAFFPAIQEGLDDADVDVLMTVGPSVDVESIGPSRPAMRVASYVPQRAVLDHCAVVISHGGYGTLLDAIDAAVPLVVVPFGADQHLNAAAVERLGIGIVVRDESLSPQAIRNAVDQLLDPGSPARLRIQELRASWRALPDAAAAVEALTSRT